MDIDIDNSSIPALDHDVPVDSDSELVPISELWNAISGSHFYNSELKETGDLFDKLQCALTSGESLFPMPLAPMTEEISFDDETESNFGIELEDDGPLNTKGRLNLNNPVSPDHPMYPWPSKAHFFFFFITALLFSSPRLPFSEAQKKAILSWAKELGALDVSSLYALNRFQETVKTLVRNPTEKVTARSGNIFYLNDVGQAVAKDYANPLTRMSQMLFELPSPPAAKVDEEIYFVNELLQDSSGDYFIPERFFFCIVLHALGRAAQRTEEGFIVSDEQEIIPTTSFRRSFREISLDVDELACGLTPSSNKYAKLEPNPLCTKSRGRMVYAVPLIIFMDDVSGNISKQWNKHHTIYMSNANLPREMLEKEFCVRFAAESGTFAWDCKDNEEVMLVPYGLFLGGDNPMHAEECSHAGLHCNYFCRTCEVGGTKEYKESDEGYSSIFVLGQLRTPAGTAAEIRAQFVTALQSGASEKIKKWERNCANGWLASSRNTTAKVRAILNKELEDLLQGSTLDDAINPLLGVKGFNVHQDTPTEILHTVLLGFVKYFWGQTDTCRIFARQDIVKHIATGGYWFDAASKKWVRAGDKVLSYVEEHPEQARLLGIHTETSPVTDKPVPWTATRYISQRHVHQERTETAHTRPVVQHQPSPFYLLNAYSIHNHTQIRSVIPQSLRDTPLRVLNVADVRLAAARQIREKKAAKKAGETPGAAPVSAPPDDVAGVPAVFDRPAAKAASKAKPTQKAKEKVPRPCANPRHPHDHSASCVFKVPPLPTPVAHPLPMTLTWQYHHPPPTHAGQYAVTQPLHSDYPQQPSYPGQGPFQPSVPAMTPHIWNPRADPSHHDQLRRLPT
ncbi:hypothetical protein BD769DRAFT_1629900 [Suillus cothurnatus]|nr:hypothetical protein BD769DRAFT_1629900 [Suillus cothurnatus]